jgi:hypothetical protein
VSCCIWCEAKSACESYSLSSPSSSDDGAALVGRGDGAFEVGVVGPVELRVGVGFGVEVFVGVGFGVEDFVGVGVGFGVEDLAGFGVEVFVGFGVGLLVDLGVGVGFGDLVALGFFGDFFLSSSSFWRRSRFVPTAALSVSQNVVRIFLASNHR